MRITRLTDYGIVLLSHFAASPPGTVLSARELAEGTGLPGPTVSKICKTLTRQGLLDSTRGNQGGYGLARDPEQVTVGEIITALEGPIALTDCAQSVEPSCGIEPSCPVRRNWQRITRAVREALDAIPLAEMAQGFVPHPTAPSPTTPEGFDR